MDNKGIDPGALTAAATMATAYPLAGQYALIFVGAVFGAMIALSRVPRSGVNSDHTKSALPFLFRSVAFATFLASVVSEIASAKLGVPVQKLFAPVALLIAVVGDDWFKLKDWLINIRIKGKAE